MIIWERTPRDFIFCFWNSFYNAIQIFLGVASLGFITMQSLPLTLLIMCLAFTLLLTRSVALHFIMLLLLRSINIVIGSSFLLISFQFAITYLKRLQYYSLVLISFTYGAQSLANFKIKIFIDSKSSVAYKVKNIYINTYYLCYYYVPLRVFP